MHHSITKQYLALGSALLLGFVCTPLHAQSNSKPPQRALIQLDRLMGLWKKSDAKPSDQTVPVAASAPVVAEPPKTEVSSAPQPASIPTESSWVAAPEPPAPRTTSTPLPPTSQVLETSPVVPVSNITSEVPSRATQIAAVLPAGAMQQAKMLANQQPADAGQTPLIIVVPANLQPGTIDFAPRQVSPEVSQEFWPIQSRNPLGHRETHGLFTWSGIAKSFAKDAFDAPVEIPETKSRALLAGSESATPTMASQQAQSTGKALLPSTQSVAKPVHGGAKPLFGRSEPKPQPAPAVTSDSRALFAKPSSTPAQTQAAPEAPKSRALFTFGRREPSPAPSEPTPTLVPRVADESVTTMQEPDVSEAPPTAPTLTEVHSRPQPEQTSQSSEPELRWRAKGTPRSSVTTTARTEPSEEPSSEKSMPTVDVVPVSAQAPEKSPATTSGKVKISKSPISHASAKSRALLPSSVFGRQSHSGTDYETSGSTRTIARVEEQLPEEKAIVPNFMAMVRRVKNTSTESEATDDSPEDAAEVTTVSHTAPTVDMASRRSYYAPPVERAVEIPQETHCRVHQTSHRKVPCPACVESSQVVTKASSAQDTVAQQIETMRIPTRCQPVAVAHQSTAVKGTRKKSYRRLTLQDITASFARPLHVVNELTKLPGTNSTEKHVATNRVAEVADVEIERTDHSTMVTKRNHQAYEVTESEVMDEDAAPIEVIEHPDVIADDSLVESSPNEHPATKPRKLARIISTDEHDSHVDEPASPTRPVVRSGRRQVNIPVVDLEDVGSAETEGLSAMQIRNSRGTRVVIFSGNENDAKSNGDSDRENPLR